VKRERWFRDSKSADASRKKDRYWVTEDVRTQERRCEETMTGTAY